MKVKIYFKGLLKGMWIFDFIDNDSFNSYLVSNKNNIKKYEII